MAYTYQWLLSMLLDERGEVGDQDQKADETTETDEEQALDRESEDEDTDDTEDTNEDHLDADETDTSLKESEEDETTPANVPYARFKEVNERAKTAEELETKLDQFKKLGPDAYYNLYPDERPEGSGEGEGDPGTGPQAGGDTIADVRAMTIEGGDFDGMTFGQVFDANPRSAYQVDPYYAQILHEDQQAATSRAQNEATALREQAEKEVEAFRTVRAKEAFGKDIAELSQADIDTIDKLTGEVTDWMLETGRGGGIIEDAFFLMNKEGLLEKVKSDTVKNLVKVLSGKGAIPSISPGKTTGAKTGAVDYTGMNRQQLEAALDAMTDAEEAKFLKAAPKEVKAKFPDLPWD